MSLSSRFRFFRSVPLAFCKLVQFTGLGSIIYVLVVFLLLCLCTCACSVVAWSPSLQKGNVVSVQFTPTQARTDTIYVKQSTRKTVFRPFAKRKK